MDLTNLTALLQDANFYLSLAEADLKRTVDQMPRRCHAYRWPGPV
jgi:hypothetical protein